MEQALVSIIAIAIILGGTVTLVSSAISPIDSLTNSWKQMTQQSEEIARTDIDATDATVPAPYSGTRVEITIRNEGKVSLCNYDSWDVIVQYYSDNTSYSAEWLPYTTSLADNNWTVSGIYFNGSSETFEPDILNPGEDMKLLMQLDPPVMTNSTNWATISTANGVSTRVLFQRGET